MKKVLLLVFISCLTFAFIACGQDAAPADTANGDAAAADGEETVIHWLCSSAEDESWVQGVLHLADLFAETNPGFSLVYENATDQAARSQRIRIAAAADALPEWISTDSDPFMQGVAQRGDIVNIKELLEELDATDRFYDIAFKFNAFDDGSLYFFSFITVMEYFWIRPSHFEAAGICKDDIITFDDFNAALQSLQDAGFHALGMCNSEWYVQRFVAMVPFRLTGNGFIDELKFGDAYMSDAIGMESAEWLASLTPFLMDGWAANDHSAMVEAFFAGNSSIMYFGTWDPTTFIEDGELKYDVDYFWLPVLGGGRDINQPTDGFANSGTGTAFSTAGMNDVHKEFIAFLIDNLPDAAVEFGFLPSVIPTDEQIAAMPPAFQSILADVLNVSDFSTAWDINVDPVTYQALGRETVNLLLGQITPEEFTAAIDYAVQNNARAFWDSLED